MRGAVTKSVDDILAQDRDAKAQLKKLLSSFLARTVVYFTKDSIKMESERNKASKGTRDVRARIELAREQRAPEEKGTAARIGDI